MIQGVPNVTALPEPDMHTLNSDYINQLYDEFLKNPSSVPEAWARYFESVESALERTAASVIRGVAVKVAVGVFEGVGE